MRTTDVNAFKGQLKNAVQEWLNHKIDEIFPNKVAARTYSKRAINNAMSKFDDKINGCVEGLFLFFGDESGTIDSDTFVDGALSILEEMKPTDFNFWFLSATVGNGEIALRFPHNAIFESLTEGFQGYRFTSGDIKEMKNYFNA